MLKANQNSFSVPKTPVLGGFGSFHFWPNVYFSFSFSAKNMQFWPKTVFHFKYPTTCTGIQTMDANEL